MNPPPVDAVLVPLSYAGAGDAATRLRRLQAEFAPLLGAGRVFVRHQGDAHFLSADPSDSLLVVGTEHPGGQARYDWTARDDGVSLGRKRQHDRS